MKQTYNKKYRVIYGRPMFSYQNKKRNCGGIEDHYKTLSTEELKSIPIKDFSTKNAVLFLWVPAPLFPEALSVIESWGFKYKTNFIWDKVSHNIGYYSSVRHEHLVVATKGSCMPDNRILFDSVQSFKRSGVRSEKPEVFRSIIEALYNKGNKLELFPLKENNNWDSFNFLSVKNHHIYTINRRILKQTGGDL